MLAAFVLLAVAGVLVAGAVLSESWLLLAIAAAVSVVLGAAATRITYAELSDSRRDAARDRAELARDYRDLSVVRSAEHHRFVTGVETQITAQQIRITKIEGALEAARAEAGVAQRQAGRGHRSRRARRDAGHRAHRPSRGGRGSRGPRRSCG